MAGTLFVVATPIGNLEDITLRALRVLKEADLVVAEDTRSAGVLLSRHGIKRPLLSCHEHNEEERAGQVIRALAEGKRVGYVSEAGTPGGSDPGARLVARVTEAGYDVVPIPGPCAATAALSASGLPADEFVFVGFLPPKAAARRKAIETLANEPRTMVFYEAPHRVQEALSELAAVLGNRRAAVFRELTKLHEEAVRGTLPEVSLRVAAKEPRGEYVLVVSGSPAPAAPIAVPAEELRVRVERLCAEGSTRRDAVDRVAKEVHLPRRAVYAIVNLSTDDNPSSSGHI